MDCTNVFCAHAVLRHVLRTGGTRTSSSVRPACCKPTVSWRTAGIPPLRSVWITWTTLTACSVAAPSWIVRMSVPKDWIRQPPLAIFAACWCNAPFKYSKGVAFLVLNKIACVKCNQAEVVGAIRKNVERCNAGRRCSHQYCKTQNHLWAQSISLLSARRIMERASRRKGHW